MFNVLFRLCFCLALLGTLFKPAPAAEPEVATVYTSYFAQVVIDDPHRPGLAYELVSALFNQAGLPFNIIHLPWARAQFKAKHTPRSLIFPFSRTKTREPHYVWEINIFNNQTHFITFNNTKLTPDSARNKRIGVQLKSSWDNWLTEEGYQNVYRVPEDGSELVKLLRNDRIDAWYTDKIIGDGALRGLSDPGITYSEPVQIFYTFLATQKSLPYPHMDKLKTAMEELRQSGELQKLFDKYGISPNY